MKAQQMEPIPNEANLRVPKQLLLNKAAQRQNIPQTFILPWNKMHGTVSNTVLTYTLSLTTRPGQ